MSEPQNTSGLMDQIHELKRQLADAEKRGAVKYARGLAKVLGESATGFTPKDFVLRSVAEGLLVEAGRIESGEVTLP